MPVVQRRAQTLLTRLAMLEQATVPASTPRGIAQRSRVSFLDTVHSISENLAFNPLPQSVSGRRDDSLLHIIAELEREARRQGLL